MESPPSVVVVVVCIDQSEDKTMGPRRRLPLVTPVGVGLNLSKPCIHGRPYHLHERDNTSFADPAGCSSYGARHATCKDEAPRIGAHMVFKRNCTFSSLAYCAEPDRSEVENFNRLPDMLRISGSFPRSAMLATTSSQNLILRTRCIRCIHMRSKRMYTYEKQSDT